MLGDYVTLEQGTGAVHTAPGHGADDFLTGVKYGLDDLRTRRTPADTSSRPSSCSAASVSSTPTRTSRRRWHDRGRLWHRETFVHQYPHCWRCHNPVIFLATSQWFVRMDGEPSIVREDGQMRTLREAAPLRHRPPGAVDSGLGTRPHLQHGGEPAGLVHLAAAGLGRADSGDGLHVLRRGGADAELVERAAAVFEQYSADAWYERPIEEFLPPGSPVRRAAATTFERETDILDVWFDSGSSHEAVLPRYPDLTWPSDMYLEGSDQHRGWFQSSLLVALGHARPPAVPRGADARLPDRPRRPEDVEVARQRDRAAGGHQGERRRDPPAVGRDDRVHAKSSASARRS